jgi:regulator of sirC expression with transglutaminase-like and TPR domain
MADQIASRVTSGLPSALIAHLHQFLFDDLGFCGDGDDFYAPQNSYLPIVVRRRRGIPISLSLVYVYLADRLGLEVQGINAPGHFLVAVQTYEGIGEQIMFVDPFFGGALLNLPEVFERIGQTTGRPVHPSTDLLAPASHAMWLARMLLNLQAIFARAGRDRDLFAMQELQLLLDQREQT